MGPLPDHQSTDVAFVIVSSGPTSSVGQEIYYSGLTEGETSLKEASDMAREYAGPHGFDPVTSLQNIDVPGLWLFGAQDSSIPVPLSIEILDSIIADHGKDFSYIIDPNRGHGWKDENTGQIYPVLYNALSWLDEKFRD